VTGIRQLKFNDIKRISTVMQAISVVLTNFFDRNCMIYRSGSYPVAHVNPA
jgi:hypothetical protein